MEKRSKFIDILRGIAIILVVMGHCIQYGNGINYSYDLFYDNILFKFIYSFHMPLFMLISGYLFYFSLKKYNFLEILKNKFKAILLPLFSFATISLLIKIFIIKIGGGEFYNLGSIIKFYLDSYWFLYAIFFISIGVAFVNFLFKKNSEYVYGLIWLISFFLPDIWVSHTFKYVYPYFIIGYEINKRNILLKYKKISKNNVKSVIISILLFSFLFLFYKKEDYIYTSWYFVFNGNGILKMLKIDMYRFLIGLVGSEMIIGLVYILYKKVQNIYCLQYIGKESLGIYAVSNIIFNYLPYLTNWIININYFFIIIETILILVICLIIIKILSLNRWTCSLFLGNR